MTDIDRFEWRPEVPSEPLLATLVDRNTYIESVDASGIQNGRVVLAYHTRNNGDLALKSPVGFSRRFMEEPAFTTGVILAAGKLVSGQFPNVTAGVARWQRDGRGYYVGAYLFFTVDGAGYRLRHHLVFEGRFVKMLHPEVLT